MTTTAQDEQDEVPVQPVAYPLAKVRLVVGEKEYEVTDIPRKKSKKNTPVAAAMTAPVPPGPFSLGTVRSLDNQAAVTHLQDRTWSIAEEWAQFGWPWMSQLLKGAVALTKGEH